MENKRWRKRGLAWVLAVLTLLYALPLTALAEEDWIEPDPDWEDEVQLFSQDALYPVTLTAGEGGSLAADCTEAAAGQWVCLTVTADTGYETERVSLNGERLTPDESGQYGFFQPEEEAAVAASFLPCVYEIHNLHPGFQTDAEQAAYGETVTLTPLIDRAVETLEITAGEEPVFWEETEGIYRFVQPAAEVTIRGTFLQKYQTFFDAAGEEADTIFLSGGSVARDRRYHLPGEMVTITATPEETMGVRQLDALAGDLLEVTKDGNTYRFSQPEQDVKITVTFDRLYRIDAAEEITVSRETAFEGESVCFTIQPPPGKTVKTVEIRDEEEGEYSLTRTEDEYRFRQPARDVEIRVTYDAITYQIRNTHAGVALSGKQGVCGETIRITPIARQYVNTLLVETEQGEPVTVEEGEDGWFFCQPAADVVVKGTAQPMYQATFATMKNGTGELDAQYHLPGEEVVFWATPEEGFDVRSVKVEGKSGAVVVQETELGFAFIQPEEDVKITVAFARRYQVTAADEAVAVSSETPFAGEKVTISVTPRPGETVSRVSVQGADGSKSRVTKEDGVYVYTQPERDVEVVVTFAKISYPIHNSHVGITVSAKKACYGDKVVLTPLADRHLDTLEVLTADGSPLTLEQEDETFVYYQPASEVTITGTSRQMYQTVFLSMKNGTATLDATYHLPGETVILYPEPEGDYEVQSVVVTADGKEVAVSATETGFAFCQPETKAKVKVTFARRYTVSVEQTWDGTIEVSNTTPFPKETVELRIRAYTGKSVSKVTAVTPEGKKCRVTRSGTLYRFTMPESDVTVTVVFKRSNGSAKTGDTSHITLTGSSMLLSAAGLLLLLEKRKKFLT